MSDEEWKNFGNRCPKGYKKINILGRGGFAMVWLIQSLVSKEKFAVKQILTNNHHKTHLKEIWFGKLFFENGVPKEKFKNYKGCQNLSKMMNYSIENNDTWIFYELGGKSLGSSLYDLKGEGTINQEKIYKIHYKQLYNQFKQDINHIKKLIYDVGNAILLLSDQNIVHSDVKTENILLQKIDDNQQYNQAKLIDYGSSFTFGNLKHFSMATPEYMAPEILNYILYQNQMTYFDDMLQYLKNYKKPYVIDIWSLGCVVLELISGIPLWMSLKTIVNHRGKDQIKTGIFSAKGRVFEEIIKRQVAVVQNLEEVLEKHNYSGIQPDKQLKQLLQKMLDLNPMQRINPLDLVNELGKTLNLPVHIQQTIQDQNNNIISNSLNTKNINSKYDENISLL